MTVCQRSIHLRSIGQGLWYSESLFLPFCLHQFTIVSHCLQLALQNQEHFFFGSCASLCNSNVSYQTGSCSIWYIPQRVSTQFGYPFFIFLFFWPIFVACSTTNCLGGFLLLIYLKSKQQQITQQKCFLNSQVNIKVPTTFLKQENKMNIQGTKTALKNKRCEKQRHINRFWSLAWHMQQTLSA